MPTAAVKGHPHKRLHPLWCSVDGSMLGMQVRQQRRRRTGCEPLPPLPAVQESHFHEVKTGVLLLPAERVETSPGRHSVVRRFLVSCLGNADDIFRDRWVHRIAEDLRAGKVLDVIERLKQMRPRTPELREKLQALIAYYTQHAGRMRYDEYIRLGYGVGSGAVESAHKQVLHARLRQAGMRWSEAGARRLLALRLLLLNDNWALPVRLPMVSLA